MLFQVIRLWCFQLKLHFTFLYRLAAENPFEQIPSLKFPSRNRKTPFPGKFPLGKLPPPRKILLRKTTLGEIFVIHYMSKELICKKNDLLRFLLSVD